MKLPLHTPGPWSYDGPPNNIIVWCGPDKRVAFVMTSDGPAEANAKLIAAAPDMLEALEYARGSIFEHPGFEDVAKIIDAAMTKARQG